MKRVLSRSTQRYLLDNYTIRHYKRFSNLNRGYGGDIDVFRVDSATDNIHATLYVPAAEIRTIGPLWHYAET